ncbi:MAG: hypothetical protein VKJ06_01115 [Vampirovibrionales bacterium]|nr:hypothetical protein [Vampirovibrionales bacterium]
MLPASSTLPTTPASVYPIAAIAVPLSQPTSASESAATEAGLLSLAQTVSAKMASTAAAAGGQLIAQQVQALPEGKYWLGFVAFYPAATPVNAAPNQNAESARRTDLARSIDNALSWALGAITRIENLSIGIALEAQVPPLPMAATPERQMAQQLSQTMAHKSALVVAAAVLSNTEASRYRIIPQPSHAQSHGPSAAPNVPEVLYQVLGIATAATPATEAAPALNPLGAGSRAAQVPEDMKRFSDLIMQLSSPDAPDEAAHETASTPTPQSSQPHAEHSALPTPAAPAAAANAPHQPTAGNHTKNGMQPLSFNQASQALAQSIQRWLAQHHNTPTLTAGHPEALPCILLSGAAGAGKRAAIQQALQYTSDFYASQAVQQAAQLAQPLWLVTDAFTTTGIYSPNANAPAPFAFWRFWLSQMLGDPPPDADAQTLSAWRQEQQNNLMGLCASGREQITPFGNNPTPAIQQGIQKDVELLSQLAQLTPVETIALNAISQTNTVQAPSQDAIVQAFVHLLTGLSINQPVVIALLQLDTLAKADPQSLNLLEQLICELPPQARVLFILSESGLYPFNKLHAQPKPFTFYGWLQTLNAADMQGFITAVLHQAGLTLTGEPLPESWLKALHHKTQGVPLVIDEALRFCLQTQQLSLTPVPEVVPGNEQPMKMSLTANNTTPELPEGGIAGLIQARTHLLGHPTLNFALSAAACFGPTVPVQALAMLLNDEPVELRPGETERPVATADAALQALWQAGFLMPGSSPARLQFRHPVLLNGLLEQLPANLKSQLDQLIYQYALLPTAKLNTEDIARQAYRAKAANYTTEALMYNFLQMLWLCNTLGIADTAQACGGFLGLLSDQILTLAAMQSEPSEALTAGINEQQFGINATQQLQIEAEVARLLTEAAKQLVLNPQTLPSGASPFSAANAPEITLYLNAARHLQAFRSGQSKQAIEAVQQLLTALSGKLKTALSLSTARDTGTYWHNLLTLLIADEQALTQMLSSGALQSTTLLPCVGLRAMAQILAGHPDRAVDALSNISYCALPAEVQLTDHLLKTLSFIALGQLHAAESAYPQDLLARASHPEQAAARLVRRLLDWAFGSTFAPADALTSQPIIQQYPAFMHLAHALDNWLIPSSTQNAKPAAYLREMRETREIDALEWPLADLLKTLQKPAASAPKTPTETEAPISLFEPEFLREDTAPMQAPTPPIYLQQWQQLGEIYQMIHAGNPEAAGKALEPLWTSASKMPHQKLNLALLSAAIETVYSTLAQKQRTQPISASSEKASGHYLARAQTFRQQQQRLWHQLRSYTQNIDNAAPVAGGAPQAGSAPSQSLPQAAQV